MFVCSKAYTALEAKLRKVLRPVAWNPHPSDYIFSTRPHPFLPGETVAESGGRSLSAVLNRGRVVPFLQRIMHQCQSMLQAKAYLHWVRPRVVCLLLAVLRCRLTSRLVLYVCVFACSMSVMDAMRLCSRRRL
jgi:hypothetical protein